MDDFEGDYKNAVEAGRRNLRATKLLSNWCFHAELVRSLGRGMIEAETGLPIGHMGVQCKFSKKNSMLSWLLEDAAYDFYQNNCKGCKEHLPVGVPNILKFIDSRERAAEQRKREREEEVRKRQQAQTNRQRERAVLRCELSLEETFVLDLVDELDQEDLAKDDPRLEQLANLAPEIFTRKVIQHLLPAAIQEDLPYSMAAAKTLLKAPLEPDEKFSVAVRLVISYENSPTAIEVVISNADRLSRNDLIKVVRRFVSMAVEPPPEIHIGYSEPTRLNAAPIQSLFEKVRAEICAEVSELINDTDPEKIGAAAKIILAIDSDELFSKHARSIFAKLMRRRTLLPKERRDSSVLYYLRKVASRCFDRMPETADKIIQAFLADKDKIGRKEAYKIYSSVLEYHHQEIVKIEAPQKIAFKRLLWAAVEIPEDGMDDAGEFFSHSRDEFAQLAVEHFEDLIGAAATLSEKYEQVDAKSSVEVPDNLLAHMEKDNKLSAINSLQRALTKWAAIGAKSKGREGIEEFLELYRRLPENQTQMRGNMVVHVSKLLTGVESLTLVLSDWYRALMDESTLVRARAVQAWEYVPYDLVKNCPDLFFEAFSVLLTDSYVMVHRSAVRALRHKALPEEKRSFIKPGLWNLIFYYSQENKKDDFIVDCVDVLASLCISTEERQGKPGQLLSGILLGLEGSALYHAVDRLYYKFADVPGFTKVVMKSIQSDYTRRISIDHCMSAILRASQSELQNSIGEIKKAFKALRPFRPGGFVEALLYAATLTRAGDYAAASNCFNELLSNIPVEDRNEQWRLKAALIATASEIEHVIGGGEAFAEMAEKWNSLLSELEKENEERAKFRDFPPSFFFED